jgi:hypothetical protein
MWWDKTKTKPYTIPSFLFVSQFCAKISIDPQATSPTGPPGYFAAAVITADNR